MMRVIALVLGVLSVALGASVKGGSENLALPHIEENNGDPMKIPYSVRLRQSRGSESFKYCGAARLNKYWFVTAAECLDKKTYSHIQITYPDIRPPFNFTSRYMDYNWQNEIAIHPDYNNITKENNIGLISCYFCGEVKDKSMPRLPKPGEKYGILHYRNIVSGWTIDNSAAEFQAKDTSTSYETTMFNSFFCKLVYFFKPIRNEHICASSWGGKRITEAHIGAPLVVEEKSGTDSKSILIGIAASVQPWTTTLPLPTVFTDIAHHAEWISRVTYISID